MRIVFIGPFGLQPKGTMSVRALPLAKALAARGHTLTMLIPPWDDPERAGQRWIDAGVEIINTELPRSKIPGLFHMLLTRKLVGQALAAQPEVVHCFKPKAYAGLSHLALWWLRRLGGPALRLGVDADDWEQAWNELLPYSALQKRFFAWQERWGLRQADFVSVASRALAELAAAYNRRLGYLPNGLPAPFPAAESGRAVRQKWQLGDGPVVLLYTRFAEFRLERIVRLVGLVAAERPAVRWLIVGQGFRGEEKRLAAQLAGAGLRPYVRFTGWPVDSRAACFGAADVAIYPYDDTLLNRTKCSVKLIELMAAGLPVVADAVGQNRAYIEPGQSGLLVPAEDEAAFGRALLTLLREPETRRRLGRAARQRIEQNFTWARLAPTVEKLYESGTTRL